MIIHVGVEELKQAFKNHWAMAQQCKDTSSYLLLFYAAESGLKSIYLRRNKFWKTDKIKDETLISTDGHNLDRWIKELKIPASQIAKIPHLKLNRDGSTVHIKAIHQAWRYGAKINVEDEKQLVLWLENLCNWIKENINQ